MIYEAVVVAVDDMLAGGNIRVVNTELNGPNPFSCYAMSPFGGNNAGMFGPVGVGASVAITKVHTDPKTFYWVYLGAIYKPTINLTDINSNPKEMTKNELETNDTITAKGKNSFSEKGYLSHGIPKNFEIYEDDGLPGAFVIASQKGHSIVIHEKSTSEIEKQGIALKTALGKQLFLEDNINSPVNGISPATIKSVDGESEDEISGNKIGLIDERGNRVLIITESSEHKDTVSVGGREKVILESGRRISIRTHNRDSELFLECLDGGEIKIRNDVGSITISDLGIVTITGFKVDISTKGIMIPISQDPLIGVMPTVTINKYPVVVHQTPVP